MQSAYAAPKSLPWIGWLVAFCASLSFSIAPSVGRAAILSGMEPVELLVSRFLLAVSLIWLTLLIRKPKSTQKIDLSGMGSICLVGLLNGAAMLCFFFGLARLDASMIAMALSTLPVFVLMILALQGERLNRRKITRLALAIAGLYLLIGPGGTADPTGMLFAMVAVILFAIQLVLVQPLSYKYDSQTVTRYVMTVMLVVIFCYWWYEDGIWQWPSNEDWFYIILLGVVSTYAARLFLYSAIRHVGSGQMSLLMPLETLLSICWAVLFLNERLNTFQWIGGTLIVFSAVLAVERIRLGDWRMRWRVWSRT